MSQLTFTESEAKEVTDFLNYIVNHAKFEHDAKGAFEFTRLYSAMIKHSKKCEDHIMELKSVIEKPKGGK